MDCQRCCQACGNTKNSDFPKTRITPTFVHQPIFDDLQNRGRASSVRFTPTFHSTMFDDGDRLQLKNIRHRPLDHTTEYFYQQSDKIEESQIRKSMTSVNYKNDSRFKRQVQLNPHFHGCPNCALKTGRNLWYDTSKQNVLKNTNFCNVHGISRERKLIELSSEPFISHQNQKNTYFCRGKNTISQNQEDIKVIKEQKANLIGQNNQQKGETVESMQQIKKQKNIQPQLQAQAAQKMQKVTQKQKKYAEERQKNQQGKQKTVPKRPQSCLPRAQNKASSGNARPIFKVVNKNRIK